MEFIEIEVTSPAGALLAGLLARPEVHRIRIAADGGPGMVKIKANEHTWSPPLRSLSPPTWEQSQADRMAAVEWEAAAAEAKRLAAEDAGLICRHCGNRTTTDDCECAPRSYITDPDATLNDDPTVRYPAGGAS
jgi:hypothetical protein